MKLQPFRTLRGKIILSLILLIIVPVVWIMFRFYDSSTRIIETQIYQSNQTVLERKALTMNELLTRTAKASNLIVKDPDTLLFLRDTPDWITDYSGFTNYRLVIRKLSDIRDLLLDSDSYLALYDLKGHVHTTWAGTKSVTSNALQQESWYEKTVKQGGRVDWTLPYLIQEAARKQPLLVLTRLLQSEWENGDGLLMIAIPAADFFFSEQELGAQQKAGVHSFLMQEGNVIFGDAKFLGSGSLLQNIEVDGRGISRVNLDGITYLVNQFRLPGTGWTYFQLTESSAFRAQLSKEKNRSIGLMTMWFALFTVAFVGLMFRFTQPIGSLIKSMNRVGKGDLSTGVIVTGRDEVAWLGIHFNRMVQQLKQLVANLSEEQQRKEKAQFQALQAQINPHFLLNTMNSIKWMAHLSGAGHVSEMLTKLGKLLNYTMRQHEEIVTIQEELDYLNVYLALQDIRYHDQISLEVDMPEEVRQYETVKFTLQPIVENSIIHGDRFPLRIRISCEIEDESLLLKVSDNGAGMVEQKVRQVEEQMIQPHAKYSGIGMRNVHERLRFEFGEQYGLRMESAPGQGVTVTIRLPLQGKEHEHEITHRG